MIVSLRCKNFRCFRDTGLIELAPITLLVGENNSGKSAILQALHIPALTLQSEDPVVCIKLIHKDYDYGSFKDIVFKHDESSFMTLSFVTKFDFKVMHNRKLRSEIMKIMLSLTYRYLPIRKEIYLDQFVIEDSKGERLKICQDKYSNSKKILMRDHNEESNYISKFIERKGILFKSKIRSFKTTYDRIENKYGEKSAEEIFMDMFVNEQIIDRFETSFRKINLLGPLRVPPSRTYLYSGELAEKIGAKGEFSLQNYAALLNRGKKEDLEKVEFIKEALYKLGFIKSIDIRKIEARYYEFWTQHNDSSLSANLADTGFGTSQVLPVLISLFTSPSGSTLLYEQPELHLHPAGQAELGSIFAKACSSDKRIVIETHSENLILRIQTEIAKKKLKPQDVKIYYILPKKDGHILKCIDLDEKGRFIEEWPKGFFEENYNESLNLLRARQGENK